ncbi:MAG: hypothetical protein NDJ90_07565, partial [Oligoflexia bacterium]|nr:hypothetical protein [Oligoflexia bacterium]
MKKNHLARAIVFKAVATLGVAGVLSSCVARLNAPVPLEPGAGLPVIVQSSPSPVAPAGFSITPLTTVLATGSNTSFMAVGGEAPYTYDVYYGAGAIDPATGAYTAPVSPGTATVRALDADGSTAYATVEITDAPVIDPSSVTVAVGNRYRFSVQGGKGPYSFGVASGLGTVSATGEYAAPATATTAVVRVTDSVGRSSDSTVTVSAALAISPKTGSVPVSGTLDLSAAGGVGEKSFTLLSGDGAVDPVTGLFTAPPVTGMAAIKVQDELGNVDVAILTINNPLRINPPSLSLARGSSFAFSASGGRPPYTYFVPVTDDGSINSSTGAYTAPSSTGLAIITVRDNLGQEASSVVTVTESLEFLSPNLTLMVGDEVTFSAQGGTPGYFFSVPSSGFTGAGATYTAQAAGTYLVDVSDSQIPSANTAQASVVVNPLLTISPAAVTLAVGNAWAFSASGGIPPYTYSPSGGSINASTGAFTAPATVPAGGTVTVTVTDAGGHPASATVTVNAALSISPATKTLVANGAHTFVTAGGVPPYTYTVSSGGGAVNSATGAYVAPAGVGTAIVRVSDSLGNVSEASVSVVAPLAITPSTMMLLKGTQMPFAASGGLAPYTFAVISGQGDVEASAGLYEAPSAAGTATVRVSDALGGSAEAAVTIYDGLTISPFTKVLAVNGSATFSASGGLAPYAYSVHSGGGSITASGGAYTAPAAPGVATIRVTDAAFNTSDATVTINPALAISVAQNPIAVGNVTSFAATGGVPPYVFTVQSGGGAINASTGDYTAPAAPATVVVRVTDSAVPVAFIDTSLTVNGAVAISPLTAQLVTSGTQVFTASGGAGGYTFSVSSGGGSFTGGTYTAPASPGNVIVRATDILGNYSEAPITVYAPLVLTPATKELAVNNSFTFIASGGVQPYTYSKVSGEGTFAAGVYQAPVAAGSGSAVIK